MARQSQAMGKTLEQQPLQQLPQSAETMAQQQQLAPQQLTLPSVQQLPQRDPYLQLATEKKVAQQLSQATLQAPEVAQWQVVQPALAAPALAGPIYNSATTLSRQSGEFMRNVFHESLPRILGQRSLSSHQPEAAYLSGDVMAVLTNVPAYML